MSNGRAQGRSASLTPLVSVVIPSYNHARFVGQAIRSVEQQTYPHVELVVVDDGSSDGSGRLIERQLADSHLARVFYREHPNLGAAATIDRGVMLSSGEYVAILNSDDTFTPDRVERLMRQVTGRSDLFMFSGVAFCDRDDRILAVEPDDPMTSWYHHALQAAAALPTAGYALLAHSLTVSTSNFFFNRELFHKVGGFRSELLLTHDWDFALRSLTYAEPRFVPDELVRYRYHPANAVWNLADRHALEGRHALGRYLASASQGTANPLAPTRRNWPLFFDVFCASVRPWFGDGVLAQQLAVDQDQSRPSAGPPPERDLVAVQQLRDGLNNAWLAIAPAPVLRARCARNWAALTPQT